MLIIFILSPLLLLLLAITESESCLILYSVYVKFYNFKSLSSQIMLKLIDTKMVSGFKIFENTMNELTVQSLV